MRRVLCLLMLIGTTARAQMIAADRPGVGADPDVVPQFTVQGEVGTDGQEGRLGLLPGFEIDRDQDTSGAKLALVAGPAFKLSVKAAIDDHGKAGFEAPLSVVVNRLFYVTTDVVWTRTAQTYVAEFNLGPTPRLTISPTAYYDTRARGAVFLAWIPPGHDSLQLDIGYDRRRVVAGISLACDLKRLWR